MTLAATWMDLESVSLSEVSQIEKEKYCMTSLTGGIKRKWYEWTYLQKRKRLTDLGRLRKWIYDCQQRGVIVTDFWKVIYTLLCLKWITNKDILSSTWNSAQCYMPDWMGTEFGWVPLLFTWNYHNTVNWLCAVLSLVSHVWLFVTPCTIAYHASLSVEFLQARILKWVAMPSSRGSSQPSSPTL